MNPIKNLLKAGLIFGTSLVAASASATAADVNFQRYFQSSTALAAAASAISILEPCEKTITFAEKVEKDSVTLSATCPGANGDAITVNLSFQKDESGALFPDAFDYTH